MKYNFNIKDIIYIAILVLFFGMIHNHNNKLQNKLNNYESAISAINDSIHKSIQNNKIIYSKKAPEININDLINSQYFKTLSKDQQTYYKQLSEIKGLIAATNVTLQNQGQLIANINTKDNPGKISKDSISFKLGTKLPFTQTDTTKKLKWNANVTLNKDINFEFNYDYKIDIATSFERQKDKSIVVKYNINDPDLKINNMQNFIIPTETPKTKLGLFYQKNKKVLIPVAGSLLFLGGAYVGLHLK